MGGRKRTITEALMNNAKVAVIAFGLLASTMVLSSCADLREEFDPSQWRYSPVPNAPPSWENDFGRPDMDGGEDPWQ